MSEGDEEDFVRITSDLIRNKILHVLKIYPQLSPSMLQVGIGTAIPPKMWHPILEMLHNEGKVKTHTIGERSPTGRDQSYQIISLA
jgi:hypothetical protein